jgi:glycosyltransferase involved in cell wall biosynthesis
MGWDGARVTVIHNGIDTNVFQAQPPSVDRFTDERPLVIGLATRLVQGKGIDWVIQALSVLRGEGVPCRLVVAGEGREGEQFKTLASSMGVSSGIDWLGFVSDMPAFYRNVDLFVLLSEREGLPLTVLEAMACSRPVLATGVMGIPEIVTNGREGFLVNSNPVGGMVDVVRSIVDDPLKLAILGQNARQRVVAAFSLEKAVLAIADLYDAGCIGVRHA